MSDDGKTKRQPQPPDLQLAQVFGFSGEDLAVNRSGYMTRRQQGRLEFGLQRLGDALVTFALRGRFKPRHGFKLVKSLCGRARLLRLPLNDPRFRQTRAMSYALFQYQLVLDDAPAPFTLTEPQYAALGEGLIYRVYFDPEQPGRILSLERMATGCEDTA